MHAPFLPAGASILFPFELGVAHPLRAVRLAMGAIRPDDVRRRLLEPRDDVGPTDRSPTVAAIGVKRPKGSPECGGVADLEPEAAVGEALADDQDGDAISKQPGDVMGQVKVKVPADNVTLFLDDVLQ